MDPSLNNEIWDRLLCGKSMDDLPVARKDGRLDVGELFLPEPEVLRRFQTSVANVTQIDTSRLKVRNAKWNSLDFTGSSLQHVLFFDCSIENCIFDKCDCRHWHLWDCSVARSSFKKADLREAVLGGVGNVRGQGCTYLDIDFSGSDLRRTIHKVAVFEQCDFSHAKLSKIDFQGSRFVDCIFEGELNDVIFYRHAFQGEAFPPNEMINVDFRRAKLHDVGFRLLKLDRVLLPQDSEHLVIARFDWALDKMISDLKQQEDEIARKLCLLLEIPRKWTVPNQAQGVINLKDCEEVVGNEGVNRLLALVPK